MDGTSKAASVRIGVQDVGSRVVVRYQLAPDGLGPAGEHLTDVVGFLRSWSGGLAVVERRDGESVSVAVDRIVAAKTLPAVQPRARRRPQVSAGDGERLQLDDGR